MPVLALALAGFASLAPQAAASRPVAQPADAARSEAAAALALTLNSEAIIIGDAADDAKALALVPQLIAGSSDLALLEKRSPGIVTEFSRRLMPITNRSSRERLPELRRRQAALYAAHFNAAELQTLNAFYTSSTGAKLLAVATDALKPDAMLAEMKASPDFKISPEAALKDIQATRPAVTKAIGPEDQDELMKLAGSGLLGRLQALAPRTQAVVLAWMDESAPWEEAATAELLNTVMTERGIEIE
jgi:hypothetical protein